MRDLESVFCKSTILVKMGWTLLAVDTHRVDAKRVNNVLLLPYSIEYCRYRYLMIHFIYAHDVIL